LLTLKVFVNTLHTIDTAEYFASVAPSYFSESISASARLLVTLSALELMWVVVVVAGSSWHLRG
jgi:hypothetical protein